MDLHRLFNRVMRGLAARIVLSLLTIIATTTGFCATGVSGVRVQDGLLWLDLDDADLTGVVREVGRQADFKTFVVGTLDSSTSLAVTAIPVAQGLGTLLAHTDHIVVYENSIPGQEPITHIASLWLFGPKTGDENTSTESLPGSTMPLPDDGKQRSLAVLRLTQTGATDDVINTLGDALLDDPDALVRSRAAMALGSLADPRGVSFLAQALMDTSPSVRAQAMVSMGQTGGEQAVRFLGDVLLQHSEARMRLLAAQALRREGSSQALQYLEAAASDPDPQVRALIAAPPAGEPGPLSNGSAERE